MAGMSSRNSHPVPGPAPDSPPGRPARAASRARHLARGERAETAAARWLEARGLVLVARNWRCRFGELDLVLRDGETLVFAEVRLRRSPRFGGGAASIDARKQARIAVAARHFLAAAARWRDSACRFDVVVMNDPDGAGLEWIRNAFQA
jgi:putative endonuclease